MTVLNYSIIRYVPDPRREEFINVGVVVEAEDDSFARCRFTSDWKRARRFGVENISFLKDVAAQLEASISDERGLFEGQANAAELKSLCANWQNSIQLSSPRASVDANPKALLARLFEQYIGESGTPRIARAGKRRALPRVYRSLSLALSEQYPHSPPQIVRRETLKGSLSTHQFDLTVRNGKPLLCVDALSAREDEIELNQQVRATASDIQDVREKYPTLALCIVLIDASIPQFNRVKHMYKELGADVTKDESFQTWARAAVRQLPQ